MSTFHSFLHPLDDRMKEVLVYLQLTQSTHHHIDQEKVLMRLKWIWREKIPITPILLSIRD
jgi:hypothetical protein